MHTDLKVHWPHSPEVWGGLIIKHLEVFGFLKELFENCLSNFDEGKVPKVSK
jgi:hypothetical protein